MAVAVDNSRQMIVMQGIQVPATSKDPKAFMLGTRRLRSLAKTSAYNGLGSSDQVELKKSGILAGLIVKVVGSLVVTLNSGTCASTWRWPYDVLKSARFTANGVSNLIQCGGWPLKAREMIHDGELTDRGVANGVGGASPGTSRTQGTLALASEAWGVGQNVSAIAGGTYDVELDFFVPVAWDQRTLLGAIFAQTSATDLVLNMDWASSTDLFTLTGAATAVLSLNYWVEVVNYEIPLAPNGDVIVPDLTAFHQLVQTRTSAISNGVNEVRLSGQGVGRQLQRLFWRVFSGSPAAALAVNSTNIGQVGWKYGTNEQPEQFTDGITQRYYAERTTGVDLGGIEGFTLLDFSSENAFRDSIDEGAASELRIVHEIPNAVSLTNPFMEYTQEVVFAGAAVA